MSVCHCGSRNNMCVKNDTHTSVKAHAQATYLLVLCVHVHLLAICVSVPLYPSCPPLEGLVTWTISTEVKPLVAEARFLVLILFRAISAISARSSASSSSWTVFLYLDRLLLACSSYSNTDKKVVLALNKHTQFCLREMIEKMRRCFQHAL